MNDREIVFGDAHFKVTKIVGKHMSFLEIQAYGKTITVSKSGTIEIV